MPDVIDANITTRSETDAGDHYRSPEDVAHDVEQTKRGVFVQIPSSTITVTFVPSVGVHLETGGLWEAIEFRRDWPERNKALANAWAAVHKTRRLYDKSVDRLTRATKPTSTTVSSIAHLLRMYHRDECLRRMSPEARVTYERIRALRDKIGPIDFDVVEALQELRNDE